MCQCKHSKFLDIEVRLSHKTKVHYKFEVEISACLVGSEMCIRDRSIDVSLRWKLEVGQNVFIEIGLELIGFCPKFEGFVA